MIGRRTLLVTLLLLSVACDCEPWSGGGSAEVEAAAAWSELSYCLAGDEDPSPELLERIGLAAKIEHVERLPSPPRPTPEGERLAPPSPRRHVDVRSWPRRCAQHADTLERALEGEPAEHPAHRVAEALGEGEIDEALYTLVERARSWPTAAVIGVTPPPAPASPLARADAPILVPGTRCATTSVLVDTSVSPSRHVAQVACRDGVQHQCTVSGQELDTVSCAPVDELADVWQLEEATLGPWTLEARRHGQRCTYFARTAQEETVLGEADCGVRRTWARPCRVEDGAAVVFVHPSPHDQNLSQVALLDGAGFGLLEPPAYPKGDVVTRCEAGAVRFVATSSRSDFVREEMEIGMLRPPTRTYVVVESHRCTSAGCETRSTELVTRGRPGPVAPLADGLVVVEVRRNGTDEDASEGLFAHVAPFDALEHSQPQWIFGPEDGMQLRRSASLLRWAVGERAVVLFVSDQERGLMAVRFDEGGAFSYLSPDE